MYDLDFLQAGPGPLLLVAGTADSYCPVEALHRLAAITSAEEADHRGGGPLLLRQALSAG